MALRLRNVELLRMMTGCLNRTVLEARAAPGQLVEMVPLALPAWSRVGGPQGIPCTSGHPSGCLGCDNGTAASGSTDASARQPDRARCGRCRRTRRAARSPARIQLTHRLQPPRTRRVLRTPRHPHRRHHRRVINRLEHTFDDSRGHRQVRYGCSNARSSSVRLARACDSQRPRANGV
jgi:hypothetical protein